jgi:hypothetical protein
MLYEALARAFRKFENLSPGFLQRTDSEAETLQPNPFPLSGDSLQPATSLVERTRRHLSKEHGVDS